MIAQGYGVSFSDNVTSKIDWGAHVCEYTTNCRIVHFKRVNYIFIELLKIAFKVQWKTQHLDHSLLMKIFYLKYPYIWGDLILLAVK